MLSASKTWWEFLCAIRDRPEVLFCSIWPPGAQKSSLYRNLGHIFSRTFIFCPLFLLNYPKDNIWILAATNQLSLSIFIHSFFNLFLLNFFTNSIQFSLAKCQWKQQRILEISENNQLQFWAEKAGKCTGDEAINRRKAPLKGCKVWKFYLRWDNIDFFVIRLLSLAKYSLRFDESRKKKGR